MYLTDKPDATGDLRRSPIAQLFVDLIARRFTGTLLLRAGPEERELEGETTMTFADAQLTQTRMPQPIETLGDVLRAQGIISRTQCDASLLRLARREGLQGEILVALGACTAAQIDAALAEQLRRKFVRLFALVDARFALFSNKNLLSGFGAERQPIDVSASLWAGVRSYPSHPALEAVLARISDQTVRLRATLPQSFFRDHADAQALLAELMRGASVAAMQRNHPPKLVRPLLYLLALARQLEVVAPGGARPQSTLTARSTLTPERSAFSLNPPQHVSVVPPPFRASMPEIAGVRRSDPTARSSTPCPSPEAQTALLASARARLAAMQDQTAFEVLGVRRDATNAQLTSAAAAAAQRWRPSAASNAELAEVYEAISAAIIEAERTLSDSRARDAYLIEVDAGRGTLRARRERAQRQESFVRAEAALRKRDFAEGERIARSLVASRGDDIDARLLLVSALLELKPTGPFDEPRKIMTGVLEKEPENERAIVLAARLLRCIGEERRAVMQFVKAYRINPRNVDAGRELRLAVMRQREAGKCGAIDNETAAAISRMLKI